MITWGNLKWKSRKGTYKDKYIGICRGLSRKMEPTNGESKGKENEKIERKLGLHRGYLE